MTTQYYDRSITFHRTFLYPISNKLHHHFVPDPLLSVAINLVTQLAASTSKWTSKWNWKAGLYPIHRKMFKKNEKRPRSEARKATEESCERVDDSSSSSMSFSISKSQQNRQTQTTASISPCKRRRRNDGDDKTVAVYNLPPNCNCNGFELLVSKGFWNCTIWKLRSTTTGHWMIK